MTVRKNHLFMESNHKVGEPMKGKKENIGQAVAKLSGKIKIYAKIYGGLFTSLSLTKCQNQSFIKTSILIEEHILASRIDLMAIRNATSTSCQTFCMLLIKKEMRMCQFLEKSICAYYKGGNKTDTSRGQAISAWVFLSTTSFKFACSCWKLYYLISRVKRME